MLGEAASEAGPNAAAVRRLGGLASGGSGRMAAVRQVAHWQAVLAAVVQVLHLAAEARQDGLEESARAQLLQQQVDEVRVATACT